MHKKLILLIITALLLPAALARAVPAYPGALLMRQPDGTTLTVRQHGDEYLHYQTTDDGYTVVRNSAGYYVYAERQADGELAPTSRVAHDAGQRQADEQAWLQATGKHLKPRMSKWSERMRKTEMAHRTATRRAIMTKSGSRRAPRYDYTKFRGLVILVEYNNCQFSRSDYKDVIDSMFNQKNYTGYDNTEIGRFSGSVRDYFYDNSNHLFDPAFDIVGPVMVNYSMDFAEQNKNAKELTMAAIDAVDEVVNFKDYDCDGDGVVDMVYFIFAGHGSHYDSSKSLLWAHASTLGILKEGRINPVQRDEVTLGRYACSTELMGTEKVEVLEGIGVICHEFSHVLGLPDLYDVGGEGDDGQSNDPNDWTLMAHGNYLDNGRTPAGWGIYERYTAGFATPEEISETGTYRLYPIAESNAGYKMKSKVDNEFFLMEYRHRNYKWDHYLPGQGMLVFRVDSTDTAPWENNKVNSDPNHNYYELLRAGGGTGATASDPFPGTNKVTWLSNTSLPANLKSRSGKWSPLVLWKIAEYGGVVVFDVLDAKQIDGEEDGGGNVLPGFTSNYGIKYWFDDAKELAGQVDDINEEFELDVSTLTDGLHALHIATYKWDNGIYKEAPAETRYFVKDPVTSGGTQADYLSYVDGEQVWRTKSNVGDEHETHISMTDISEGLHQLTTLVKTPGEAQTSVTSTLFLRVPTPDALGSIRLTCSIDGVEGTTLEQGFQGDSLSYELDVSELEPGLHRLTYQLTSANGTLDTQPTTTFFLVDPQLKTYEYWLNGNRSTLTKVSSLYAGNPYELVTELKVREMPVRSSVFKFAVEDGQPVVYAVNDLTIRFTDNTRAYTDSTVQYVDTNTKVAVTNTTLLEKSEPTAVLAPAAGTIKWFRIEAYRGDGILLQASRSCSMHLFAPDGEEIYRVSGDAAKTIAGTNGRKTGTYYVAVHDISDGEDGRELVVTYHPGASILTEQVMASLEDNTQVYRGTTVALTCATKNAVIWFTTDASEPSLESETTHRYNGEPIAISGQTTLRAIATCADMQVSDEAIYHYDTHKANTEWQLENRWRWVSHNQADDVEPGKLYPYVSQIWSETEQVSVRDGELHLGSMSSLTATQAYKVAVSSETAMKLDGDAIDPSQASMELHKGWNWIGYPVSHSQTLSEAFGTQAKEGDVLCGQLGYAIYEGGQWKGTLQTMDTGRGYLLMSPSSRVLTLLDEVASETQPQKEPFEDREGLSVDIYRYPFTLNVTAQLFSGSQKVDAGTYAIGAFCGDECRGVAESIDGCYFLTMYGNADEHFTLKAVEAATGHALNITEEYDMAQDAKGTPLSPVSWSIDVPTGIRVLKADEKFNVYNIYGHLVRKDAKTLEGLPRGIYIVNGRKVVIK